MSSTRRILLYAAYAVLVVAFGVVIGLAFQKTPSGNTNHSVTGKAPAANGSNQYTPGASPKSSSPPSTSSNTSTNPKPAAAAAPNSPPSQLTNTGPGDVIAIFVGTSVLGAIAHWRFASRKLYL